MDDDAIDVVMPASIQAVFESCEQTYCLPQLVAARWPMILYS